jgi:hypothetical protein
LKPSWTGVCLGGSGLSISQSSISGRICVGCSDKIIRIVDPKDSSFSQQIWKGIQSKVTIVKYHPELEDILLFGCSDGRVGFLKSNKVTLFHSYHQNSVSCLDFFSIENEINILSFSVGSEEILIHQLKSPGKKSESLNLEIKEKITEISSNKTHLCVGMKNGIIQIFDKNWKKLLSLNEQTQMIQKLKWSFKNTLLASSSEDKSICIYSEAFELISTLRGHENSSISDLSWSPHQDNYLVSCSFDKTAQVWNATTGEALFNYRGHSGAILSVQWSLLDEKMIYSSGDDDFVKYWNFDECTHKTPKKKQENERNQITEIKPLHVKSIENKPERKKEVKSIFKLSNTSNLTLQHKQESCIELLSSFKNKKRKRDQEPEVEKECDFEKYPDLSLFSNSKNNSNLFEKEIQISKNENSLFLNFFKGNVEEALKLATEEPKPNLLWLALSQSLGKEIWEKMCKVYATKYEEIGEIHIATSIHLAYHNIKEAIETLKRGNLFRDAISLYKSRINISNHQFCSKDDYLYELYQTWAEKSLENKDYEVAAKCYFSCGEIERGIKCIESREQFQFKNLLICSKLFNVIQDTIQMKKYLYLYFSKIFDILNDEILETLEGEMEEFYSFPHLIFLIQLEKYLKTSITEFHMDTSLMDEFTEFSKQNQSERLKFLLELIFLHQKEERVIPFFEVLLNQNKINEIFEMNKLFNHVEIISDFCEFKLMEKKCSILNDEESLEKSKEKLRKYPNIFKF